MQHQATPNAKSHAPILRNRMTDSERRLWSRLRMEQLGAKFRRQHPLGNYIADFAWLAPRLIVELDGSQHADQLEYDAHREGFFRNQGFAVLHFGSNEVFLNLEGVLAVIAGALAAAGQPPSQPSPRGGRGNTAPSLPSLRGGRSLASHVQRSKAPIAALPQRGKGQKSSGAAV